MNVIISHPTSNEFNRAAVYGLLDAGSLMEFHTSIAAFPGTIIDYISKTKPFQQLQRRRFKPELQSFVKSSPLLESGRQMALKFGLRNLIKHEKGVFSLDAVYQAMDKQVASSLKHNYKRGAKGVFAYEDGALLSFKEAKRLGLSCFYDLPIGYWRAAQRIMKQEMERWPEWTETLIGLNDSEEKLARKDEELALADKIFVASRFTASTLSEHPQKLAPVEIVPYGFPDVYAERTYTSFHRGRPLKILFVGGLSQRKGIADLFKVADTLADRVELTVVGLKSTENCAALNNALNKYKWIPTLPHHEVLQLMRANDVLVFPSVFEGFGLVITEAMSQGTPVITTDHTAGPDIMEHNNNGWLIKAGSTDALQNAVEELLLNPDIIAQAGKNAIEKAKSRPWSVYSKELVAAILNS